MDRYWFFTWRTYGTWLPGQPGFVGYFHTPDGRRVTENTPNTPTADPIPALERYARSILRSEPVLLNAGHAAALLPHLLDHARYRGWCLDAVAVLVSHAHVVFGVPGDPDPDRMLADWKAYASRPLNRLVGWPPPAASAITQREAAKARRPVWWEVEGSTRPLKTVESRIRAIRYVRDQENPLAVWLSDGARRLLEEYPEPAPEPS